MPFSQCDPSIPVTGSFRYKLMLGILILYVFPKTKLALREISAQ